MDEQGKIPGEENMDLSGGEEMFVSGEEKETDFNRGEEICSVKADGIGVDNENKAGSDKEEKLSDAGNEGAFSVEDENLSGGKTGKFHGGAKKKLLAGILAASVALNVFQGVGLCRSGVGVIGTVAASGSTTASGSSAAETGSESTSASATDSTSGNGQTVATGESTTTDGQTTTTEDDVTIDGQYVIRSTTAISDAYLSGDTSGLTDEQKETLTMASDILKEIITDDMSDYEKELAVYTWMCANLETDEGVMTVISTTADGVDTPYGVLKNRKAICVGYATTFRLFMQMMEIDCKVIHSSDLYHAWNLVKIDGHWYHVDVYSDVGSGNYATFNLSDEMMQSIDEDAEEWDTDYFPAADSVAYTYLYQNSESATDIYALAERLRTAIDAGETTVALKYETALTDEEKQVVNEMVNRVSMLLMTNQKSATTETYMTSSVTDIDGGSFVLVNIVTYEMEEWDEEEKTTLSEETQTKVSNAVEQAFADYAQTTSESSAGTE